MDYCQKAIDRSRSFAEKWLKTYQCKGDPDKAANIAQALGDVKQHLSHGAAIDHAAALDMGLDVQYLPPEDDLWGAIWRLYCDYVVALRGTGAAQTFESRVASITY